MAAFKCKICGGELELLRESGIAQCGYCGVKQTLQAYPDERRAELYERANHFRRNSEFDRAREIYESVLNEDNTDAEAYWQIILCKYGVAYVEDPATHRRVPTVNRAQFTSIFADEDYRAALRYASGTQRQLYEEEAERLDKIQREILSIAQNESPFDIFLCYKEQDTAGERTPDSVLATELYYELTKVGFRVFFARITLEGKLGVAYEPYIFAALHSAKVMVVLGTKAEYLNAPWVRNEWSRYLALIKSGEQKVLIPAYRDMDPYELPKEFSHLQAQNMAKLGFMQDLIHGISKLIGGTAERRAEGTKGEPASPGIEERIPPLLRRAELALEEEDFAQAERFYEEVLDLDAENAKGYLGKLLVKHKLTKKEALAGLREPFEGERECQRVLRFADETLAAELRAYNQEIIDRNETAHKEQLYSQACALMEGETSERQRKAGKLLALIVPYKDAEERLQRCKEREKALFTEKSYQTALERSKSEIVSTLAQAVEQFEKLAGYKDSAELLDECSRKLEEKKKEEEIRRCAEEENQKRRKRKEKILHRVGRIILWATVAAVIGIVIAANIAHNEGVKREKYLDAVASFEAGNFYAAQKQLAELRDYKDSASLLAQIPFAENWRGDSLLKFGRYQQSDDPTGTPAPLYWKVVRVDRENKRMQLMTSDIIEWLPYYDSGTDTGWERSVPRAFLNGTFLETAFTEEEQSSILETQIESGGAEEKVVTNDKVFLLSAAEIEEVERRGNGLILWGSASEYVGTKETTGRMHRRWWLRDDGAQAHFMRAMTQTGDIGEDVPVEIDAGIRPVIWLSWK